MKDVVIDASVALAWCFPDETSEYADAVLIALEDQQILVPAVWSLEVVNALVVAQKQKRISVLESKRFAELLESLTIREVFLSFSWNINNVQPIAQEYGLSAYDASYLAVAIRHNAPLATLDSGLAKAARKSGIEILLGENK